MSALSCASDLSSFGYEKLVVGYPDTERCSMCCRMMSLTTHNDFQPEQNRFELY
jgi:hypothetical protein